MLRAHTVSVLVNNAGVVSGKTLLELSNAEIRFLFFSPFFYILTPRKVCESPFGWLRSLCRRTIGVNLMAHYWTLRAFLPTLMEQDGGAAVVTVSSLMGQVRPLVRRTFIAAGRAKIARSA